MKTTNVEDIYELSPLQQGLLFHTLYDNSVYFRQAHYTLHGQFNRQAFEQAWQQVVDRHQALRTSFHWKKMDKPLQVVHRQVIMPIMFQTWSSHTRSDLHEQMQTLLEADRQQSCNLEKPPLMRLTIARLSEEEHWVVWSYHHLLLDGWSLGIIIQEVYACYAALCQGQKAVLPRSHPYSDYITWLKQQDLTQAEAFWRETLKGFTEPTPLGIEQISTTNSGKGKIYCEQVLAISVEMTNILQTFSRSQQLTLNTVIQAAWAILLSRYSGQQDILFGTTVSGRPPTLSGVESIVGLFINTLPVRISVPSDAFLLPWLKRIQDQQAELRQYYYSPLMQIQGWSEIGRGRALFESLLVMENYPQDRSLQHQWAQLEIQNQTASEESTNYPLCMIVALNPDLKLRIAYERERFKEATIRRMLNHLQTLLEGIVVANPAQMVQDLPLLSVQERHEILEDWNNTHAEFPSTQCLNQLFEEQVERTPDAVALFFEEEQLTYLDVNQRANQLAHTLRRMGIGLEGRVGICLERCCDLVVAILATLKAGATYIHLDPALPRKRLTFMLTDAQVELLLTHASLAHADPFEEVPVMYLDLIWSEIVQESRHNLALQLDAQQAAYIIYTSGSTGQPKGVVGPHQAIINRLYWGWQKYPFMQGEVCCQKTSLSFVDAITELFSPLLHGVPIVLLTAHYTIDPTLLVNALARWQVSRLVLVPSLLRTLLENTPNLAERLPDLHLWMSSGEVLPTDLVQRFRYSLPGRILLNLYGSSEVAADATAGEVQAFEETITIGQPLSNMQIYVLDKNGELIPAGIGGELFIGGVGVARGYLKRPDQTAEYFVPDPFGKEPGARLYRTGDRARYRNDGTLEYLGRVDQQLKIRGYRIEPGEIEIVLNTHTAVAQSVVVMREEVQNDRYLVAYIVPYQGQTIPTFTELHEFLRERLPSYMIPSSWIVLSMLPQLPNGKLDRRALRASEGLQLERNYKVYLAPRTPEEETLTTIWAKILCRERVSVNENFFELGGNSLLSIQVVARANEQGLPITLQELFQHPTIAQLVAASDSSTTESIGQGTANVASSVQTPTSQIGLLLSEADKRIRGPVSPTSLLVNMQSHGVKQPFFCIHPGGGHIHSYSKLAQYLGQKRPFYGIQAAGLYGEQEPHQRVEEMAAHYIEAMRTVQPHGPYLLGGWSFGGLVAFEIARQLRAHEDEVAFLALLDTHLQTPIPEDDAALLTQFVKDLEEHLGYNLTYDYPTSTSGEEWMNTLLDQIKTFDKSLDEALFRFIPPMFRVFKLNGRAGQSYVPGPYTGRVTSFWAEEPLPKDTINVSLDWPQRVAGEVKVHLIPGNHNTMVKEPNVHVLAQMLRTYLDVL